MNGLMKIFGVAMLIVTGASATAVLLVPPSSQERETRRQAEAQRLVDQLTQEVWNYFHERGAFPPGDGSGSAGLVAALRQTSPSGVPFLLILDDMVTSEGDLRNPLDPERLVIHYRNNRGTGARPGDVHNVKNFDLWCQGAGGVADGVNNWSSIVSGP